MRHSWMTFLVIIGLNSTALAQDTHYWDNQYGTKAELLGGLVVGSPSDLSATFYNPGWVALHGDPSILLTTKAIEAYSIKLNQDTILGPDPVSSVVTTSPGYLAGRFTSSRQEGWQWAYSYLQKVKFDFDASLVSIQDFVDPEPVSFSGEAFRVAGTNEYWYGLTLSRKIHDNVGLGFSPYLAYRSMNTRTQASAQALDTAGNFSQAYEMLEVSFSHARLLMKIGLAAEWGRWSAGLAVTTPSLGIYGSGKVNTDTNFSGLDRDDNGVVDAPYLSSDYQEGLNSSWKSPVSVAAGASYNFDHTTFHTTVEWFNGVAAQRVMDPLPYQSQSTGEVFTYDVTYNLKSVVNVGVAVNHRLRPRFSLFGSARTDFSALSGKSPGDLLISNWDLWHFTVGALFEFLEIEFTTGLQYSVGRGNNDRFLNFDPGEGDGVLGEFVAHDIDYHRLKVMLGFNLPFGNPMK